MKFLKARMYCFIVLMSVPSHDSKVYLTGLKKVVHLPHFTSFSETFALNNAVFYISVSL